jgi:hypothetical protein
MSIRSTTLLAAVAAATLMLVATGHAIANPGTPSTSWGGVTGNFGGGCCGGAQEAASQRQRSLNIIRCGRSVCGNGGRNSSDRNGDGRHDSRDGFKND